MKHNKFLYCSIVFLFFTHAVIAQKVRYSEVKKENVKNVVFEILGKIGPNFVVYKNLNEWKNSIQVFDSTMKEISDEEQTDMPQKVLNVNFVTFPTYFLMVYQYKKNATVYCDAVKIDAFGKKIGEVIRMDTSKVGAQSGAGIYNTIYSENKRNILIYKMLEKNEKLHIVTKLYDQDLQLVDSTRSVIEYNERKEVYGPFQLANDGTIFFSRESIVTNRDNIGGLELISNKKNSNVFNATVIDIGNHFIDGVQLKIDNLNNHCIINSFYYPNKRGSSIEGLFSALVKIDSDSVMTRFNQFDDSLRVKVKSSKNNGPAFENLFLRNIFVKKDGGYFLVAEDFSVQTLGNNNSWNRYDYLYGNPGNYNNSYYYNSPYYNNYRYNNTYAQRERYYYENILIMNIDSSLQLKWNSVIMKSQTDDGDDRYLSYGTVNVSTQVHFLFVQTDKKNQVINNQSIDRYGKITRYATLKTLYEGYDFMPRFVKQVGARQIFVPCAYRGNLCFALIDF